MDEPTSTTHIPPSHVDDVNASIQLLEISCEYGFGGIATEPNGDGSTHGEPLYAVPISEPPESTTLNNGVAKAPYYSLGTTDPLPSMAPYYSLGTTVDLAGASATYLGPEELTNNAAYLSLKTVTTDTPEASTDDGAYTDLPLSIHTTDNAVTYATAQPMRPRPIGASNECGAAYARMYFRMECE
jgi:hypothetical protein